MIRSVAGRVRLTPAARFAFTSTSSYVVAETEGKDVLPVFDARGRFVRLLDPREGSPERVSGGGMPQSVAVGTDGSIHVADAFYARFTQGATIPKSRIALFGEPQPQVHTIIAYNEGVAVVQAMLPARGGGHAYHVVSRSGTIARSFGEAQHATFLEGFGTTRRRIARASGGTFWAVPPNSYVLTQWDTLGAQLRRLVVKSDWFVDWDGRRSLPSLRTARWPTVIQGVSTDSSGLVWILAWVPRASWSPSATKVDSRTDALRPLTRAEYSRAIDSMLEIVDPECGTILHRERIALPLEGFLTGAFDAPVSVVAEHDSITNAPTYTVVRFSLIGKSDQLKRRPECRASSRPPQ